MRENVELYTYKVKLRPNNKQRSKMLLTLIATTLAANFVWNYFNEKANAYNALSDLEKEEYKKLPNEEKRNKPWFIENDFDIRKKFTLYKKEHDENVLSERLKYPKSEWRMRHLNVLFYDVSNDALKQAVKDELKAWRNYFKGLFDRPRRKSFKLDGKSFYVDTFKIQITDKKVKLEKLSTSMKSNKQTLNYVTLSEYNRIPLGINYYNARVRYIDNYFYLTVAVESQYRPKKRSNHIIPEDEIIGFDLNVETINGSDGSIYETGINDKNYKNLEKREKRLQKILARKYRSLEKEAFDRGDTYTYKDDAGVTITRGKVRKLSNNYKKLSKKINKIRAKKRNYKKEKDYQIINKILEHPKKVYVLEDLDIKSMQARPKTKEKNQSKSNSKETSKEKNARKGLQKVGLRDFKMRFKDKIRFTSIRLIEADTWYPSSKTCNNCGYVYKELELNERKWVCPHCNKVIERDYNAALNLRDYGIKIIENEKQ